MSAVSVMGWLAEAYARVVKAYLGNDFRDGDHDGQDRQHQDGFLVDGLREGFCGHHVDRTRMLC